MAYSLQSAELKLACNTMQLQGRVSESENDTLPGFNNTLLLRHAYSL